MYGVSAHGRWPDSLDATIVVAFLAVILLIAAMGYVFMVLDYRAYLRSLRRALVRVGWYLPEIPAWAQMETPRCIAALGLRMPCSEEELLRAYRRGVKQLHPDHGGDKNRFLHLQQNFEEAMKFLAEFERSNSPLRDQPTI